jgi:5-carboxymethyl-2-hydroxymuconate isomerase
MAHVHLETTADLPENADVPDILQALIDVISETPDVESDTVKGYHSLRSVWVVGVGAPPGFAQLTAYVLAGRTTEWRTFPTDSPILLKTERSPSLSRSGRWKAKVI